MDHTAGTVHGALRGELVQLAAELVQLSAALSTPAAAPSRPTEQIAHARRLLADALGEVESLQLRALGDSQSARGLIHGRDIARALGHD